MRLDLEQWRDLASPVYDVFPKEPEAQASVDIEVDEIGGLFVSKVNMPSQLLVHDPSARCSVRNDYLLFERFYAGGGKGDVGGTEFNVMPSRLHLIDMSQRYTSAKTRNHSRGVCIPHELLGFDPSQNPAFASLEIDTPKGRLLAAAHAEMLAARNHGLAEDAASLAHAFVDLIRVLMLGQSSAHGTRVGYELPLAVLIKDYVEANLHQPDLNADKLAAVFNVSRPTVYRHFDEKGGVGRHIRNARLDRCYFELSGAKSERGRVAAVARRWHFTNPANFSRLFRERFGLSPAECAKGQESAISSRIADQTRVVRDWFEPDLL